MFLTPGDTIKVDACIANCYQMLRDSEIVIVGDLYEIIIITPSNNNIADTVLYPRP